MSPNYFAKDQPPATTAPRRYSTIAPKSHAEKLELLTRKHSRSGPKGIPKKKAKKRDRNSRDRIYGPKAFVTFLHSEQCLGCGAWTPTDDAFNEMLAINRQMVALSVKPATESAA